jgi:hypothetical protein
MTEAELVQLLITRKLSLDTSGSYRSPLCKLDPLERDEVERCSAKFAETDAAIVAELIERREPVSLFRGRQPIELRLTVDRLNFVEIDGNTRRMPCGERLGDEKSSMLYDYSQPWTEPKTRRISA